MRTGSRSAFCALVAALLGYGMIPSEVSAQRGGFRGPFGRGGGSGIELLFRDDIKEEVELVDEQEQQLRDLSDSMRDNMRSIFGEVRNLPDEERRDAMMARMREVQEDISKQMNEILLPHQLQRLQQLQLQSRLQQGNTADTLATDEFREKLGLTESQLDQMREAAEGAQAELREKIQQATLEAREKVLAVLTPDQRATWNEMMGESFAFQQQRGFRGRRGGQAGRGPGGRRGGGGREETSE